MSIIINPEATMINTLTSQDLENSGKVVTQPLSGDELILMWQDGVQRVGDSSILLDRSNHTGTQDSSTVEYLAPFTGAQVRAQLRKNTDSLNAADFGVVSDAVLSNYAQNPSATDNTAALQAAINAAAAQRKNLIINAGFYYVAGTIFPPDIGILPRRGMRIMGEGCETSILIGNRGNMFDMTNCPQAGFTFERLGMWARHRTPTVAYTTNDTGTAIIKPNGNMRLRVKECLFRFFETAIDNSLGSWLTHIVDSEFIQCRYGLKLKDSYATVVKRNNFICGTAIYSPISALLQCEISDNHFDLGTFREVDAVLRPYNTFDAKTQGVDFNNNYFEIYAPVHPDHIVLNINSQVSDKSVFSHTYINVGSAACVLRKINSTNSTTHGQGLRFQSTVLVSTNSTTQKSWWSFDPSLLYFSYQSDDIVRSIDINENPLVPANQERMRLHGTYTFSPNTASQQFNLNNLVLTADSSVIGNNRMIAANGRLLLKGGYYRITITPQGNYSTTVGKTIDIEMPLYCRARLFDGVRQTGTAAELNVLITSASLGGVERQLDIICAGFSGAADISMLCAVDVQFIGGQR